MACLVGPPEPLDRFASVIPAGWDFGAPASREIACVDGRANKVWEPSDAVRSKPERTYAGLLGAISPQTIRRTGLGEVLSPVHSDWNGHPVGHSILAPPANAASTDEAAHIEELVAAGVIDQSRAPRPLSWPDGLPVAAGAPLVVGIEFASTAP